MGPAGILRIEEIIVVAVFSLEYLLRLAAAEEYASFVFSFQGLVDLSRSRRFTSAGSTRARCGRCALLRLLRVLKLQTRMLENTVAERTRELANKNASLEQAQAQLKPSSTWRGRCRSRSCRRASPPSRGATGQRA